MSERLTDPSELDEALEVGLGRRAPFSQLGDWVLFSGASCDARTLYWALSAHINTVRDDTEVWPGLLSLARILGLRKPENVSKYMLELEVVGAIEVVRTMIGLVRRNRYVVHQTPPASHVGVRSTSEWYALQRGARGESAAVRAEREARFDSWLARVRTGLKAHCEAVAGERAAAKRSKAPLPSLALYVAPALPDVRTPAPGGTGRSAKTRKPTGGAVPPRQGVRTPAPGGSVPPRQGVERDQEEPDQEQRGADVRPSVRVGSACERATDGRTDAVGSHCGDDHRLAADTAEERQEPHQDTDETAEDTGPRETNRRRETTPGMEVLRRVGLRVPRLALAGRVLRDQARRVCELIAASEHHVAHHGGSAWTSDLLAEALAAPFEGEPRRSAGAVVSARIKALPLTPDSAMLPSPRAEAGERDHVVSSPAAGSHRPPRTVEEEIARRPFPECPCGDPAVTDGLCPECADQARCDGDGRKRRLSRSTYPSCESTAHYEHFRLEPAPDGGCAGLTGPCGRRIVSRGMCRTCLSQAETISPQTCHCGNSAMTGTNARPHRAAQQASHTHAPAKEEPRDLLNAATASLAREQLPRRPDGRPAPCVPFSAGRRASR